MANNRSFEGAKPADRRSEILGAAGELFSRQGFHATSMRDLAKAVNLQGGSLYAHIESKEDLLFELVNRAADGFLGAAEALDNALPPAQRMRALVRGHLEVIVRELPNATVFFHEWKFLNPQRQAQITARRDAYEARFRAVIEEGVKTGEFRVSDARLATFFVLSALNWTYHWYQPGGKLSLEALCDHYTALILRSLGHG